MEKRKSEDEIVEDIISAVEEIKRGSGKSKYWICGYCGEMFLTKNTPILLHVKFCLTKN